MLSPAASAQLAPKWQIEWTDHAQNPVDLQSPGSRAYMPYVLDHAAWPAASRYRVWYDTESINGIGYSTSADGLPWSPGQTLTGLNTERLLVQRSPGRAVQPGVAQALPPLLLRQSRRRLAGARRGERRRRDVRERPGGPRRRAPGHVPGRPCRRARSRSDHRTRRIRRPQRPFLMYFQASARHRLRHVPDGYVFTEAEDDPVTEGVGRGPDHAHRSPGRARPSTASRRRSSRSPRTISGCSRSTPTPPIQYLVSANGLTWEVAEDPVAVVGVAREAGRVERPTQLLRQRRLSRRGTVLPHARAAGTTPPALPDRRRVRDRSAFYQANDLGIWAVYSPFDNFQAEGWTPFTTTGNDPDGNPDGLAAERRRDRVGARPAGERQLLHGP